MDGGVRGGRASLRVPLNDLSAHFRSLASEIEGAMRRVLDRGWYVLGPEVEAFEAEFAAYCHTQYCVGVASGTDALELALRALRVGPGDQVATVANAGMYSTVAITMVGAEPVYVDIDPVLMTRDPRALQAALTCRTRAVIVTHLYGQMADMPAILDVASAAGVPVVEDCAQAHGARLHGRPAGSWGTAGCFSFYPTKNLGALGDGGAVVTSSAPLAGRVRLLRQYGWAPKYYAAVGGGRNSRLDELQAAVLRVELPHLDVWNEQRRRIADAYGRAFKSLELVLPAEHGSDYVAHLYVVRSPARDRIRAALAESGVGTDIHYPVPDHEQRVVGERLTSNWSLPNTERSCREVLSLPCYPEMRAEALGAVISAVESALRR